MARSRMALGTGVCVLALALSACKNGGDPGVASLDDDTGANPNPGATSTMTQEEAALAFAQCMRDNGVDFPDPTVNADGTPEFDMAFGRSQEGGFDPGDTSFRDAMEACGPLIQNVAFGGGPGGLGGQFDPTELEDAMLPYTQCLRDEGLDVGDFTLGGQGMGDLRTTEEPQPMPSASGGFVVGGPSGRVDDQGFDRSDMLARMLGQDPDDPAWIAASEACQAQLPEEFANGGGPVVIVGGEG